MCLRKCSESHSQYKKSVHWIIRFLNPSFHKASTHTTFVVAINFRVEQISSSLSGIKPPLKALFNTFYVIKVNLVVLLTTCLATLCNSIYSLYGFHVTCITILCYMLNLFKLDFSLHSNPGEGSSCPQWLQTSHSHTMYYESPGETVHQCCYLM